MVIFFVMTCTYNSGMLNLSSFMTSEGSFKMKPSTVLIACCLLCIDQRATAAIIHVPADQATIQAGVDAAQSGDTVLVAAGTYTGPGNRDISFGGKGLLLKSLAGPNQTVIDCEGTQAEPHRAFRFFNGENSDAVLSGFTIRNGYAPGNAQLLLSIGGGILCESSSPTIFDCILDSNFAANSGGGLACIVGASPLISTCRFENNVALDDQYHGNEGWGGALRCVASSPRIQFSSFAGNRANIGGAISCDSADVDVFYCTFADNIAMTFYSFEPEGPGYGGALHLSRSSPFVSFCTFVRNTAEPEARMNEFPGRGGALRLYAAFPCIINCTLYENSALPAGPHFGEGGGISLIWSSPVVQRSIIAGSVEGEAIQCYDYDTLSHPMALCSDLTDNAGGNWSGCVADQAGVDGNFSLSPQFCDAPSGELTLQSLSPCRPEATGCGLVGALPVGCTGSIQDSLWLDGEVLAHVVRGLPTLRWTQSQVTPQTEYELEVGNDGDWTAAEMWQPGIMSGSDTAIAYGGAPLIDGSIYFARVRAGDGSVWSDWFQTAFTMNSAPMPPIKVSPSGSAIISTDQPVLTSVVSFDLESDSQQVHFRVRDVLDNMVVAQSAFIPTGGVFQGDTVSWQVSIPLQENRLYRWTVRAMDGYEISLIDSGEFFSVNAVEEGPALPTLYLPVADSIVYGSKPSFAWSLATDPDPEDSVWYEFRLAEDSGFAVYVEVDSLTDTSRTLTGSLDTRLRFWWRVICRSSDGQTAQSEVGVFRTYLPGDLNASWTLTSADIITLVGYVFRSQPLPVPECAGRTNGDGIITAADIIWLVNTVFKSGAAPLAGCG